jgi:hypothetical protein
MTVNPWEIQKMRRILEANHCVARLIAKPKTREIKIRELTAAIGVLERAVEDLEQLTLPLVPMSAFDALIGVLKKALEEESKAQPELHS